MGDTVSASRQQGTRPGRGWETARRNFGDTIFFFAPALKHYDIPGFDHSGSCRVQSVSITGGDCQLMCDHCRGRILRGMKPAPTPASLVSLAGDLSREGVTTLLVSGGSDSRGVVPLEAFTGALARIHEELGIEVIVHTGITDARLAQHLAAAGVAAALIDIPGDDKTINDVLHLGDITAAAYDDSLANLCGAGLKVVPHVVIGLNRGGVSGEWEALRLIAGHDIESLVLVGLRPLEGTPMAGIEPPSPAAMAAVFAEARELLPDKAIMLGCERPGGPHKEETDFLALEAGLNGIAFPADGVVSRARELGLTPCFSRMCCAVPFADPDLPPAISRPAAMGQPEPEGSRGGEEA